MAFTAVSVDWDFFFNEDASHLYDWGHREAPLFIESTMWAWRFQSHWTMGRAEGWPEEQADLELAYQPEPGWDTFWKDLQAKGFNFEYNGLTVGESHLGGFYHLDGSSDIYHFDFHNDIHYGAYPKWDKVDCANWLGTLMHNGTAKRVTIVYPTKERMEKEFVFHKNEILTWIKKGKLRATYWDALEPIADNIIFTYVCRSGAWTPPWADDKFQQFIAACPRWREVPLFRKDLELMPRTWDRPTERERAEEHYQQMAEIHKTLANAKPDLDALGKKIAAMEAGHADRPDAT